MKKFLFILIAFFCLSSLSTPVVKGADGSVIQDTIRLVGYDPYCGCPIYAQWTFVGYDYYGRPVWQWRLLPIIHKCDRRRG